MTRTLAAVLVAVALSLLPLPAGPAAAGQDEPVLASVGVFPALSGDGRHTAFYSKEPGVTGGQPDDYHLMVHDRVAGVTERLALAYPATESRVLFAWQWWPSISGDGRYVAFVGLPAPTAEDPDPTYHVFVHDRVAGTAERLTFPGSPGDRPILYSYTPAISADGRYVAFAADGAGIVAGDTNGTSDVFVRDRKKGTTERVSVTNDGLQVGALSYAPAISADGRLVAFSSYASNLVGGDTNGTPDVFVRDRLLGRTERVSLRTGGGEATGGGALYGSYSPSLSADGRYVAFGSYATNLVPGDTTGTNPDVFVHDRVTRITERVSVATDGACVAVDAVCDLPQSGTPFAPNTISADGRFVSFTSCCRGLTPGDADGHDLFVHDRLAVTTERISAVGSISQTTGSISADGRVAAFTMFAGAEPEWGLFLRDRGPSMGVRDLVAASQGSEVSVTGSAVFSAAEVIGAPDPIDAPTGADELGGELLGASIVARPDRGDLVARLRLASLPYVYRGQVGTPLFQIVQASPGNPGIVYGLAMQVGGVRYEIRAMRAPATELSTDLPIWPAFVLYRCDLVCTRVRRVPGSLGQTGVEAVFSFPLAAVGGTEGSRLTGLRAFVGLGDAAPGAVATLDDIPLSNTRVPSRTVALGIAAAGTPEEDVAFDTSATLGATSEFSGSLDVSSLPPENYDVWARACFGAICGSSSVPVPLTG